MVDCVQIMKANSQTFLNSLQTTDFSVKNMTRGFLLENGGSIFCLETADVEVTRVLLAQVLINFKKDTVLKDNLNEILFTDFSNFFTITSGQNEDFLKNFPDLLVCILDNEQEVNKQSHILESWMNTIKINGRKIIFIVSNPKHLEKTMIDNGMTNISKLRLDKLWKENKILSNNETTSATALNECTNVNLKEEESSGKTSSNGEATTEDADLKNLLQSLGVNELDAVNRDGNTQLHVAVRDGNTKIVELLLVHGAKKEVKNNYGKTVLHLAAQRGHSVFIHNDDNVAVEHGFNMKATDNRQWDPIHYQSLNNNDAHLIEILLKFGTQIEIRDNLGRTALHVASYYGYSALVNSLLENGANINAQDNNGDTPLHRAILNNNEEVILILLQYSPLLKIKNNQQQNALDYAKLYNVTIDVTNVI